MDKKTRPIFMMPPRDPYQMEKYTQTKRDGKIYFMHMEKEKKKLG